MYDLIFYIGVLNDLFYVLGLPHATHGTQDPVLVPTLSPIGDDIIPRGFQYLRGGHHSHADLQQPGVREGSHSPERGLWPCVSVMLLLLYVHKCQGSY